MFALLCTAFIYGSAVVRIFASKVQRLGFESVSGRSFVTTFIRILDSCECNEYAMIRSAAIVKGGLDVMLVTLSYLGSIRLELV